MTREEAIQIIRETYHTDEEMKALESLIPELCESEDERIISSIIAVLENDKKHYLEEIAWLEKQKEQSKWPHVEPISEEEELCLMPQEQKPCEWSEEDEAMLDSFIRIITRFDDLAHEPTYAGPKWTHPYTKELNFLEKLRNRLFEEND